MRRARRRRAYEQIDWIDAVYRVYVTAILSAVATSFISGIVGGRPVTPTELSRALEYGPALGGLVVAGAIAAGLRSGGRGGPLVLLPADVTIVLLAPIPRAVALRGVAVRQLRFSGFLGAVIGMIAGNLAAQRLPGAYGAWVASGGVAGLITGLAFTGSALVASGVRIGRRVAGLVGLVVVGWSVGDLVGGSATSPATFLGRLAMAPAHGVGTPVVGFVLLGLPVAGLRMGRRDVARGSAAPGRAGGAAALRGDDAGRPHGDPPAPPALGRGPPPAAVGCGSPARPGGVRSGGATGRACCAGRRCGSSASCCSARPPGSRRRAAWEGTPVLVALAGLALLVAALDAIEGLAQEADHPTRSSTLPDRAGLAGSAPPGRTAGRDARRSARGGLPSAGPSAPAGCRRCSGSACSLRSRRRSPRSSARRSASASGRRSTRSRSGRSRTRSPGPRRPGPPLLAVLGVLPLAAARIAVNENHSALAGAAPAAFAVLLRGGERDRCRPAAGGLTVLEAIDLVASYGDHGRAQRAHLHRHAGEPGRADRAERGRQEHIPAAGRRPARADERRSHDRRALRPGRSTLGG